MVEKKGEEKNTVTERRAEVKDENGEALPAQLEPQVSALLTELKGADNINPADIQNPVESLQSYIGEMVGDRKKVDKLVKILQDKSGLSKEEGDTLANMLAEKGLTRMQMTGIGALLVSLILLWTSLKNGMNEMDGGQPHR